MRGKGAIAGRWLTALFHHQSNGEISVGTRVDNDASAILVLEDGFTMTGTPFGATGQAFGEVVFATGMTGYQESLTDPSYCRQILIQTAPHIGNTGWNDSDSESDRIWAAGYVVRDPARLPSNWRATGTLNDQLREEGVVGISGVDTRMLVRHLRERGPMRGGIFSGNAGNRPDDMLVQVRSGAAMVGADLSNEVATVHPRLVSAIGERKFRVVALDFGIKANLVRSLAARGIETHVVPAYLPLTEVLDAQPDGVFLSNGPGDPATADAAVDLIRELLQRRIPVFGVCFGHQLLGRALGNTTYKMRYPHRGLNTPVVDSATGKVLITSHNHGFALRGAPGGRFKSDFGEVEVSHHCPNDGTVEGLRCRDVPAFSVQFHPEAAAGPHDSESVFDDFRVLMATCRGSLLSSSGGTVDA
jgi:carbamoyl-phosphate synthase small subunit